MSMRTRAGKKISLTNYEELLAVPTIEGASDIPLDQLHEFKGHPFHVVDDEAMDELVESIKAKGVLSPAIARKRPEGGFELISGHRRTHAARRAGLDKIPVFVKDYSDDEAVCIMESLIRLWKMCCMNTGKQSRRESLAHSLSFPISVHQDPVGRKRCLPFHGKRQIPLMCIII